MAIAEFGGAFFEEADQRPVDIAESEEREVVGADRTSSGAKPVLLFLTERGA